MNIIQNITQWITNLFNKPNTTTLADVIFEYNKPFINYFPEGSTITNAEVHKITKEQAVQIANLIQINAARVGLDPLFLAAALNQESMFDPMCFNKNLKEHNGVASFAGTDWGIAQMSGNYLPSKSGMAGLNNTQMYAKAYDPEWSIPAFADEMNRLYHQSLTWLTTGPPNALSAISKINNTELTESEFLTTMAYNSGFTGATNLILAGDSSKIAHPFRVGNWYHQFKSILESKQAIPWQVSVQATWKF